MLQVRPTLSLSTECYGAAQNAQSYLTTLQVDGLESIAKLWNSALLEQGVKFRVQDLALHSNVFDAQKLSGHLKSLKGNAALDIVEGEKVVVDLVDNDIQRMANSVKRHIVEVLPDKADRLSRVPIGVVPSSYWNAGAQAVADQAEIISLNFGLSNLAVWNKRLIGLAASDQDQAMINSLGREARLILGDSELESAHAQLAAFGFSRSAKRVTEHDEYLKFVFSLQLSWVVIHEMMHVALGHTDYFRDNHDKIGHDSGVATKLREFEFRADELTLPFLFAFATSNEVQPTVVIDALVLALRCLQFADASGTEFGALHPSAEERLAHFMSLIPEELAEWVEKERESVFISFGPRFFKNVQEPNERELSIRHRLAIAETEFGPDGRELLRPLVDLCEFLRESERQGEAEAYYRRLLNLIAHVPEADPISAAALNTYGLVLDATGRTDESLPYFQAAFGRYCNYFGLEHGESLAVMANFAGVLLKLNRSSDAEALLRQCLEVSEAIALPDPGQLATHLCNLSVILYRKGEIDEADAICGRALRLKKEYASENDVETARVLTTIADIRARQDRIEEADSLYREAVRVAKSANTATPAFLATVVNLHGRFLFEIRRFGESLEAFQKALEIGKRVYGEDDPRTVTYLNNIAECYRALGNDRSAEPLLEKGLSILELAFGTEHPELFHSLNNLAELYRSNRRFEAAIPLYRRGIAILNRINAASGETHPNWASAIENFFVCLREMGETESSAEVIVQRVLDS